MRNVCRILMLAAMWLCVACTGGSRRKPDVPANVPAFRISDSPVPGIKVVKGFEEGDRTSTIVDAVSGEVIYEAGHDVLCLDTVICGNHVFFEDIESQPLTLHIVVSNPDDSLFMKAYPGPLESMDYLDEDDLSRVYAGEVERVVWTEYLDLERRKIGIRYFNGRLAELDLHGERYGDYYVDYRIEQTDVIADTVRISDTEEVVVMNNLVGLRVYRKGRVICDTLFWPDSFKEIEDPELHRMIIDKLWFKEENGILVVDAVKTFFDTDEGYHLEFLIGPEGFMKMMYIDIGRVLVFSDDIEDVCRYFTDEQLRDSVLTMNFYEEEYSRTEEYAMLFAFLLMSDDESARREVACGIHDVFARYPGKFDELHMHLRQLSDEMRHDVEKELTGHGLVPIF